MPATIVFADDQITLTGAVPSVDAADRLTAFATDYRLTPAPVVNELTIDPNTPTSGGVRVVELNSINFDSEGEVITPEHAAADRTRRRHDGGLSAGDGPRGREHRSAG